MRNMKTYNCEPLNRFLDYIRTVANTAIKTKREWTEEDIKRVLAIKFNRP